MIFQYTETSNQPAGTLSDLHRLYPRCPRCRKKTSRASALRFGFYFCDTCTRYWKAKP